VYNQLQCLIIARSVDGGLGNRMFLFASAYGLARLHQCHLYIEPWILFDLSGTFEPIHLPNLVNKTVYENLNKSLITARCLFSYYKADAVRMIAPFLKWHLALRQTCVYRYNCSLNDIEKMYSILKTQFPSDLNVTFSQLKQSFHSSDYTWIGIHIRRGDFLTFFKVSSSVEYLTSSMNYYRLKYPRSVFIIASDDKDWCLKHFGKRTDVIVTPKTYFHGHDMAALALCEHLIATAGSYGWWAGFLAGGDVVHDLSYPVRWQDCSRQTYFPPWFIFPPNITQLQNYSSSTEMTVTPQLTRGTL
ncbi:unnamed protein product, partial [Didymodactylos carnosus]